MKKSSKTAKKLSPFFIAFLAAALVFLAVGMGTLGSFRTAGGDFELRAPSADAEGKEQTSTVVFYLDSSVTETYTDNSGKEQTRSVSLMMDDVYLYLSGIYSEAGTPAGLSVRSSTSSDKNFGGQAVAKFENLYTPETADGTEEDAKDDTPLQKDALFRWVHPFTFKYERNLSPYHYWELSATDAGVRVAEVIFVGKPTDATKASHSQYIIPARVETATPDTGETTQEVKARASVLLDAEINVRARQFVDASGEEEKGTYPLVSEIPSDAVTSYDTFTQAELYSLLTVTEMRAGTGYTTDINNAVADVYHAEGVYNVLGMDLIALGTAMFGVSPFGLRFMPMLFSFGILVLGFFFVRRLFRSDRAGFLFALLYALCDFSFALGHVGTPLTAGLFFLLLSVYLVDTFYRKGIKKVSFAGVMPLLFGGLAAAAAICVNGAMVIPVVAVCGLFAAGMVRQQKANRYYLNRAIEECEQKPLDEEGKRDTAEVSKVVSENRYKNLAAGILFPAALLIGVFVFSLLFMLPVYSTLLKFYEGPASSTANVFTLGWKAFAGGFVGANALGSVPSVWSVFLVLFKGAGENFAVTAVVMNAVAAVCGLFGVVYAIWRIVKICMHFKEEGKELRKIVPPLAGLAVSLISASFGGGALGFIFLAYIFAFMLAACAADGCMSLEGGKGTAAKIVSISALVLLLVCFMLFAIFTFSVPMPAGFMAKFF